MAKDILFIDRLSCSAIIGIHEGERDTKQEVLLSLWLTVDTAQAGRSDAISDSVNYGDLAIEVKEFVESSNRWTVEALSTDVAGICLGDSRVESVRVRVDKPTAVPHTRGVGIEIERTFRDLHRDAYIGVGSNSNAETNLPFASAHLSSIGRWLAASEVFETPAVGDSGAPNYLNAVIVMQTSLPAGAIRKRLKAIEQQAGSREGKGIVPLDLDLCLLGDERYSTADFTIPHHDLLTRDYLATAISELNPDLLHPVTGASFRSIASVLGEGRVLKRRPDVRLQPSPDAAR
ncbi:MAG TPA: 2-amino-4-hydroxy-6-hydroxymethyldihydropteridine diphosphokinase [Gemmatimonadaceae bacterium]